MNNQACSNSRTKNYIEWEVWLANEPNTATSTASCSQHRKCYSFYVNKSCNLTMFKESKFFNLLNSIQFAAFVLASLSALQQNLL